MILKGDLEFINIFVPIKLYVFKGDVEYIDLWHHIHNVFTRLNENNSVMITGMNSIEFRADPNSDYRIRYESNDGHKVMGYSNGSHTANIGSYLPDTLQRLNGRKIVVDVTDLGIKIEPEPTEEVNGMYYTHNNRCTIPDDVIIKHCKFGTLDQCIFIEAAKDGQHQCAKFDSASARFILEDFYKAKTKGSRIGNCAILGRNEPPKKDIDMSKFADLQMVVGMKANYIGWRLLDSGDMIDRSMTGGATMGTPVTDIKLVVSDDKKSAYFTIVGEEFSCGFDVHYGGISKSSNHEELIFFGYMGHEFKIHK